MKLFKKEISPERNGIIKFSLIAVLCLQALFSISQVTFDVTVDNGKYQIRALNLSGEVIASRESHNGFWPIYQYNNTLDLFWIKWNNGSHIRVAVFSGVNGGLLASRGGGNDFIPSVTFNDELGLFSIVFDNNYRYRAAVFRASNGARIVTVGNGTLFVPVVQFNEELGLFSIKYAWDENFKIAVFRVSDGTRLATKGLGRFLIPGIQFIEELGLFSLHYDNGDSYKAAVFRASDGDLLSTRGIGRNFVPVIRFNDGLQLYSISFDNGSGYRAAVFRASDGYRLASRGGGVDIIPNVCFFGQSFEIFWHVSFDFTKRRSAIFNANNGNLLLQETCGTSCACGFPGTAIMTSGKNILMDSKGLKIHPNPGVKMVNISYELTKEKQVTITLFDSTGKLINILVENQPQLSGQHQIELDATDLPNGIYYLNLQSDEDNIIEKLMIAK